MLDTRGMTENTGAVAHPPERNGGGRRKSATMALLFGYASLLISLARNILFVPIYLHDIPLAEYGAWLASGGALALLLINDFGLSGVVMQKIASRFGAGDLAALGSLTGSALAIGALMALLLTAISVCWVPCLPGVQSLTAPQAHAVVGCFLIAAGANALGLMASTAMSVIRSLQWAVMAGSIALAADIANIAVTLLGLVRGAGLYAIAYGMLARSIVIALCAGMGLAVICSKMRIRPVLRGRAVRGLLGDASRFFVSSVAMKLQSQANVVFVSSVLGPGSAAIYSLTIRAHETVMMLISQINSALVPSVTHLFGSGNAARFRAVLLRLLRAIAAVTGFALSLTVMLNTGFLHLWLKNQRFLGEELSILTAIALFTASLGYVAYDALVSQGNFKFVSRTFLMSSLLQLVLLAALLRFGVWMAPVATLVCALAWGGPFWAGVNAGIRMTSVEVRDLALEVVRLGAISAATVAGFLLWYPAPNTWGALAVEGLLGAAALALGYLATSATLREIVREEIGMTIRALRPT